LYLYYSNPTIKKPTDNGISFDWFHFTQAFPSKDIVNGDKAAQQFWTLINSKDAQTTPIFMENPEDMRRTTNVFQRGNWLNKGEAVTPDVPHSLNSFPKDAPHNRLGLAQWLTDKKNPLTARTYVNRIWEQLFGQGLAETLEDLGTQGIAPTHRELLDYLAYNFINSMDWRSKTLIKTIVMSATYQQTSTVSAEFQARDPLNKLYARAPRVRLSAEQIRDQTLCVSGLLLNELGGKSVFPYQPEGIWNSPWNGGSWKKSDGKQQYRRALYTYWKRSSPYPSMLTFDGVNREVCVSRRIRTNTPLQALVSLNDSTYMVAAVEMAKNATHQISNAKFQTSNSKSGTSIPTSDIPNPKYTEGVSQQISVMYQQALGQPISADKQLVLEKLYQTALKELSLKNNKKPVKRPNILMRQEPKVAALAIVANAILNLDEFVNKS
jgi:hypothetical protein